VRLTAANAAETRALGARLASALQDANEPGALVIGLSGDLGAGKTTLVSGLLARLGHDGAARSPTYTLVEPYRLAGRDVNHCDLYRLRDPSELDDLGLREMLEPRSLLLVEWPERAEGRLGIPDLSLQFGYLDDGRSVEITPSSEAGYRVLNCFV
jgi:tRNA threonylcarbamoyladenosine biosynthesis protein TsaE